MNRLLAITALAALVPLPASADHCNEVSIYSHYQAGPAGVSHDAFAWIGCGQNPEQNTDYLLPGAAGVTVFADGDDAPLNGAYDEAGRLVGSYLDLGAEPILLSWTQGRNANGDPTSFWFSQTVMFDTERTLEPGGTATATACWSEIACASRTYRSMTTT